MLKRTEQRPIWLRGHMAPIPLTGPYRGWPVDGRKITGVADERKSGVLLNIILGTGTHGRYRLMEIVDSSKEPKFLLTMQRRLNLDLDEISIYRCQPCHRHTRLTANPPNTPFSCCKKRHQYFASFR